MLGRIWRWFKRLFLRLIGKSSRSALPRRNVSVAPPARVETRKPLTDAEYESLFLELLAGVHSGWSRGSVKGFLAAKEIHETAFLVWLRGFGERLLNSPASHQELAARMVQLNGLDVGEVGKIAGDIGLQLLRKEKKANREGAKNTKEEEEGRSEDALPDNEAEKWYNLGCEKYDSGDFEGAIAAFDTALQFNPDYYQAWGNRGSALGNLGRYEETLTSFDTALELKPDYYNAWDNRGLALFNLGRYEEALASFDTAVQFKPDYYNAWGNRGSTLLNLGRYEEALASFDTAVQFKPGHYNAWYNRGLALLNLGRYEEAIASFDTALQFNCDHYNAWYNRGSALLNLGRYEEAIASFDTALQFNCELYDAWYNRSSALLNLKRYEEALSSFDTALKLKPGHYNAWYNRGLALLNLKRYEEAIASFDTVLQFNSELYDAWYNRSSALHYLGRYEEAIASYDTALQLNPDFHIAWCGRGIALFFLKQYKEALVSCDKAIELKSDYHEAWYNRGDALYKLEQHKEAIASYDKAIKFKPDYHEAWSNRGSVLSNLERCEEAVASYDKAVEFKPNDYKSWYNRGLRLSELEQHKEAIASYDKAIEFKPDFHEAWDSRGVALSYLKGYEEAIASFDKALEFKPDDYQYWINRGMVAINSVCCNPLLIVTRKIIQQNPHLNQRGYEGTLASYEEGLKNCPQDTHAEGWGRLHQAIGNAHYFQRRSASHARSYCYKAANSYNLALQTLTATDYPEQHLEVFQDLIRVRLDLGETDKAEELQRRGTDVLQNLLNTCKSPGKKQQLALKFAGFQQLTVDIAVQSGNWGDALELAEKGKNICLHWLFGLDNVLFFPKWRTMQSLLNPTTAIVYWHLSPAALHTFILKHDIPSPIVITTSTETDQEERPASLRRLQLFEEWLKDWNQQYSDYRPKDEMEKSNHPWRVEMPTRLENLKNILCIPAIEQHLQDITQLILIPHRDLHRFPLHVLFSPKFSITHLPSVLLGLTLQKIEKSAFLVFWCKWYFKLQHDQFIEAGKLELWFISLAYCLIYGSAKKFQNDADYFLGVEAATCEGFEDLWSAGFESEAISAIFPHATRIEGDEVTKNQVETVLSSGRHTVFHFAGHGSYNFQSPKQSALFLSGTAKLTLENICHNNFPGYKLVSLSACETGVTSNQTITTEYVGLVSGFLSQGVAHVVSTLWTVQSTASALVMIEFYRRWRSGVNAVDALGEATTWLQNLTIQQLKEWYKNFLEQLSPDNDRVIDFIGTELWKLEKLEKLDTIEPSTKLYAHPYYWAAFTITGNASSHERLR